MSRYAVCLLLAAACCAPPGAAAPGTPAPGPRKKLIEFGWDLPSPELLHQSTAQVEQRPFDGVVLRLNGGCNVFQHKPYEAAKFAQDLAHLRATRFSRLTDNFVLVWATCDKGWDWFSDSDWRAAEQNTYLMAKAAAAGRCAGICFDPEDYGGNPWTYSQQPGAGERTFDAYYDQVRRRGARFMELVQRELPRVRILTLMHACLFAGLLDNPDPAARMRKLAAEAYGLWPAFFNGMLDAARPQDLLIDGNEFAYYYTSRESFYEAYHLMRQRALALIDPKNHAKYAALVQAGNALYMDQLCALRQPQKGYLSFYLTPDERAKLTEHHAYYGLRAADEYVWVYSERMNWWKGEIPPGAEAALASARRKVAAGEPLGFDIEELVKKGQKAQRDAIAAEATRRTARVSRLRPGEPAPVLDGRLDDPLWQRVKPLDPFLPTLLGGQKQVDAQTTVWAAYDERCLYVAFRCEEPQMGQLRVVGQERDDPLWQGDVVELFLSRGEASLPYTQLMVNPKGVRFDESGAGTEEKVENDLGFDPDWQASAAVGEKEWTVEMAIPWAQVGGVPRPGESRRANACRERAAKPELSTWSQVAQGFLDPVFLGTWVFEE